MKRILQLFILLIGGWEFFAQGISDELQQPIVQREDRTFGCIKKLFYPAPPCYNPLFHILANFIKQKQQEEQQPQRVIMKAALLAFMALEEEDALTLCEQYQQAPFQLTHLSTKLRLLRREQKERNERFEQRLAQKYAARAPFDRQQSYYRKWYKKELGNENFSELPHYSLAPFLAPNMTLVIFREADIARQAPERESIQEFIERQRRNPAL